MVDHNDLPGSVTLALYVPNCKMDIQRPSAHQEHRIMEFKLIFTWAVPTASTSLNGTYFHVGICIVLLTHCV